MKIKFLQLFFQFTYQKKVAIVHLQTFNLSRQVIVLYLFSCIADDVEYTIDSAGCKADNANYTADNVEVKTFTVKSIVSDGCKLNLSYLLQADKGEQTASSFFIRNNILFKSLYFSIISKVILILRQYRLKSIKNSRLRESFIHNSREFSISTCYTQRLGVSHTFVSVQLMSNVCPPHFIIKSPFSRRHLPS